MIIKVRFLLRYTFWPALTTVALMVGFWWGWQNSTAIDGMPFARSGAVGTAVLAALSLWRFGERLTADRSEVVQSLRNRLAMMNINPTISAGTTTTVDARLSESFVRVERAIFAVSSVELLVSTLIWGFGDIVVTKWHDPNAMFAALTNFGGS